MQYWQIWHFLKRNVQNTLLFKKKFEIIKTQGITIMHFANTSQALMAQLAESSRLSSSSLLQVQITFNVLPYVCCKTTWTLSRMKSNAIFQTDSTDDCINLRGKRKKRLKITITEPVLFTITFALDTGKQDHNSSPGMEFWFSPGKVYPPSLLKHTKPDLTARIPGVSSGTAACECWQWNEPVD